MAVSTHKPGPSPGSGSTHKAWLSSPGSIFALQVVYAVVLGGAAFLFFTRRELVPFGDSLGPIPLAVPWFGALGGVLISVVGVVEHQHDWDANYRFWHWSRPFVGAALGVMSVLIVKAGILAVGSAPTPMGSAATPNVLYYIIAFLVGYREETFRELMKRITDVILGSPTAAQPTVAVTGISPSSGATAGGYKADILGSGFSRVQSVSFGHKAAEYQVVAPSHLQVTVPPADAPGPVVVTVRTSAGSGSGAGFTYA